MKLPIYLDYAATTPVDPQVAAVMMDCLTLNGNFANPASRSHIYGWQAEEAVEEARGQVARLIGANIREIVWTSGATEADNLAIKGVTMSHKAKGNHIITSKMEHKAVLDCCEWLSGEGFDVTYLSPDSQGLITPEQVQSAIRPDTILVTLMLVNNEIGTLTDVGAIGALCRAHNVLFHVDAAQGVGKVPVDVNVQHIDLLSMSAHKFYGPKGIGALYVRRNPQVKITTQIHGGGHERGMRSGTLATHQIVGMGAAAALAQSAMPTEIVRLTALRLKLLQGIQQLGGIVLHGDPEQRVPGIINVAVTGQDDETLLMALTEIAISTGSACTSASVEPSFVLKAMGVENSVAFSSLRLSIGRFTTDEEIDFAINHIVSTVTKLRQVAENTSRKQ